MLVLIAERAIRLLMSRTIGILIMRDLSHITI